MGRVMVMDQDTQWLYQLLADVQLEKFYLRVRDGLNITRLEHFAYVKESDLEQIGISKPGEPDQQAISRLTRHFTHASVTCSKVCKEIYPPFLPAQRRLWEALKRHKVKSRSWIPKVRNSGGTPESVSRERTVTQTFLCRC